MGVVEFFRPKTLEEAKALVNKYSKTKVLAGGTDLILNMRRGEVDCDYVVSLEDIVELSAIVENYTEVIIGAMATFTDLMKSEVIKKHFTSLINCSSTMGSPQIRNSATLGGNIVNAGSAADAIPCVISLQGVLIIESLQGRRQILCEDYFNNYKEEKLKENEILTAVVIPKPYSYTGYFKLGKRNSLAIARLSSAVNLKVQHGKNYGEKLKGECDNFQDNIIKDIKICVGAVGRYPFRVKALEMEALNKQVQWLLTEEALNYLSDAVVKSIGGRKTMPFKREAIKGVFKESLKIALEGDKL